MPEFLDGVWLCVAAALAGGVNALAGGGTLLTFPALLTALASSGAQGAVLANATSTVALAPASFTSGWAYRRELAKEWRWIRLLFLPSLAGGAAGALLVTRMQEKYFAALVPWLILGAAALFACQPLLLRLAARHTGKTSPPRSPHDFPLHKLAAIFVFQFFVGLYGGYFGAGIGILMLSALGLMGLQDIHEMNALKSLLAGCINGVAVAVFVYEGKVIWRLALLMMGAAMLGGYLAARFGRKAPQAYIRWLVISIGFLLAGYYFWRQWQA